MSKLVLETCRKVAEVSTHVKVVPSGIQSFVDNEIESAEMRNVLASLSSEKKVLQPLVFRSGKEPTPVPIDFGGSLAAEVNYAVVLDLLQLGSGYRDPLHAHTGVGASDTLTLGSVALHNKHGQNLDAKALVSVTLAEVSDCFGIPSEGNDNVLCELCHIIHTTLINAGSALLDAGFCDFNALATGKRSAQELIEALMIVPGFRDCALYTPEKLISQQQQQQQQLKNTELNNETVTQSLTSTPDITPFTVWFMKKAQLAVSDLYERFASRGMFCYTDIETTTVFVDNVLPAVLRATGAITVTDTSLLAKIEAGTPLAAGSAEEVELRACSIVACDEIVKYAQSVGKDLTIRRLDWLLWVGGKIPRLRAVKRHFCRDTCFY